MIGKTFLRLERDFDKHVNYCRDESNAQEYLFNNDAVREFFEVSERGKWENWARDFSKKLSKFSSPAICCKASEEKSLKSFMTRQLVWFFPSSSSSWSCACFSSSKLRFYCHFHSDGFIYQQRAPTWSLQMIGNCKLAVEHEIFHFKFT